MERRRKGRGWAAVAVALALAGCGPDEPRACDEGVPTCESTLVVLLPDQRTDFNVTVSDDVGLDVTVRCPIAADPAQDPDGIFGDYTAFCGAGRVTFETWHHFGDTVEVQLEQGQPREFQPRHSKGADFCGNACTQGTIQL